MTVTPEQIVLASRQIAQDVGMFRIGDGEDPAVMEMARMLGFSRRDVAAIPSVVARAITTYLDDLVRDP